MAVESAADLAAMLDTDEFASTATVTIGVGAAASVAGIFDNGFVDALSEAGVTVEATGPRFVCRTADVPAIAHADTAVIGGTTFKVVGVHPDGTGLTTLLLEDQS